MKKLKIAVAGLGRVGWPYHVPQIAAHSEQYTLVGVVDTAAERLAEAYEKYGVKGYTDIAEMIEEQHPDVTVICTPTHLHLEHACTAMRLGSDVFLDKPMAVSTAEAEKIADFAKQSGRKLMIYQPHRAKALSNQIRALLEDGRIGRPYLIRYASSSYNRRSDWQSLRRFGGGMLQNYGAHFVDLLLYTVKDRVSRFHCFTDRVASVGDSDDVVKATFKTERGVLLDLDISQAAALSMPMWSVFGKYGAIVCESQKGPIRIRWYDPAAVPEAVASDSLAAAGRKYNQDDSLPWQEEIIPVDKSYEVDFYQKVYEYFAEDKAPYVSVEDTLYVMRLLDECRREAEGE